MSKMRIWCLLVILAFPVTSSIAQTTIDPVDPRDPPHEKDPIVVATAQLEDLAKYVHDLNLARGISNSLDAKLSTALASLGDAQIEDVQSVCNRLNAFKLEVLAQSGSKITVDDATTSMKYADAILVTLDCY